MPKKNTTAEATETTVASEGATTTATPPVIVPKPFTAIQEAPTVERVVDVRAVWGNAEQSRGKGVLAGMILVGWKAFPGDDDVKKPTDAKLKPFAPSDPSQSVMGELFSDDPQRQVAMLNLLAVHEPETDEKSIWEMCESLLQHGQIQTIRVRPCYDDQLNPIEGRLNTVAGARRCIARAVQYAMGAVGRNDDETFRQLEAGEEPTYNALTTAKSAVAFASGMGLNGQPLLKADVVEGKDAKEELFAALAENRDRKDQSPIDDALFMRELKNKYGLKIREIAVAMYGEEAKRKNKDQLVQQRLSLLRLTPEEQDRVHKGELGVVNAIEQLKKRDAGKAKPGEVAKGKPGQGERVKMPSVAQAKELLNALDVKDLTDDVKARFGKAKVFALTRDPNVRQFIALCCGVDYETVEQLTERTNKEKAAAAAEAKKKADEKAAAAGKGKGKGKSAEEAPADEE